jgi:intracellular multiplication protein IcmP
MSGNNNQGEPAFQMIIILILLWIIGWLIWRSSHDFWMSYVIRWMRYIELWPVNLISPRSYSACLDWLRYAQPGATTPPMQALTVNCFGVPYLSQVPGDQLNSYYYLSMPPLNAIGEVTTRYYRWPISAFIGSVGLYMLFFSPFTKFMTKHSLESFINAQAKMWPIITPILKLNPSKTGRVLGDVIPDKLPPFAEALSPEEWISWNRIAVVNGIPDRDATRRAFIRQLGPRWNGADSLPWHMRALLAAFALKGAQKRDESDDLLGRLALAWSPDNGFRPDAELKGEINKLLRDPEIGGKILKVCDQYAWRTTAMLGALRWARANGGVLAPAQFLWLRADDRALWYPLNNLGRRSFHSEGAGAMGHFMAEEAAKKPLPIPRIDTAVVTLNTYLHDPDKNSIPIPPREGDAKS